VIETPGHSPDHVALYSKEQGALFTGDLVVTPRPTVLLKGENVPQIIASLRCLLAYDFSTVYCAHAGPIRKGSDYQENRLLRNRYGKGARTASAGVGHFRNKEKNVSENAYAKLYLCKGLGF